MSRTWSETQAAFATAVVDASHPPPAGVVERHRVGLRTRFDVHRNNALVGLIDALQGRFPVTFQLVGGEFFRAMARQYASTHRPRSPVLLHYGSDFPAFIADFEPAAGVPYLSDVAQLESDWSASYHARDADSLPLRALSSIPTETLLESRLSLHPSLRILRSLHPIADIWAAHQNAVGVTPPPSWIAQDVLIVRPETDVCVHTLGAGVHAFVSALLGGMCVWDAVELALAEHCEFHVGNGVTSLFSIGAVVGHDAMREWETSK